MQHIRKRKVLPKIDTNKYIKRNEHANTHSQNSDK